MPSSANNFLYFQSFHPTVAVLVGDVNLELLRLSLLMSDEE